MSGEWSSLISLTINGITKQYTEKWNLVSKNTQVKINTIETNNYPIINSNVIITNEGNIDYEYQYIYCIASNFNEQCGEVTNIDYGSGAKLIKSSDSWISDLSLNVKDYGKYYFKVVVSYDNQKSGASKSFIVKKIPTLLYFLGICLFVGIMIVIIRKVFDQ